MKLRKSYVCEQKNPSLHVVAHILTTYIYSVGQYYDIHDNQYLRNFSVNVINNIYGFNIFVLLQSVYWYCDILQ